ncbi:hypothetical protein AVEN_80567-1 [Araneus ventricosus]|uniref:Uncharacterized protein n=1 Tax=Araneus ventricosus TaxID=182803 RepID=A0A4Y2CPY8_ARAVE|nr:hypothetical protein AVEN_80567-1 [Araneus ventricosus]
MTRTTPELASLPLAKLLSYTSGSAFDLCVRFNVQQAPYAAEFWWNGGSSRESSCPKAVALPLSHHEPHFNCKIHYIHRQISSTLSIGYLLEIRHFFVK